MPNKSHSARDGDQFPSFGLLSERDRGALPKGVVDAYPLSRLQAGMLFQGELRPEADLYHHFSAFRIQDPPPLDVLKTRLKAIIAAYPVLRTAIHPESFEQPLQLVYAEIRMPLEVIDLRLRAGEDRDRLLVADREAQCGLPFRWSKPPLWRLRIYQLEDNLCELWFVRHHAILDERSVHHLVATLFQTHIAIPTEVDHRFKNLIRTERETLDQDETRAFWAEQWGDPVKLSLPRSSGGRPGHGTAYSRRLTWALDDLPKLLELAQTLKVDLESLLLTAHLRVLSLLCDASSVVTGVVTPLHAQADANQPVGLFLNILPFHLDLLQGSWRDLIQQTHSLRQKPHAHRFFPTAEIQALHHNMPLFETVFQLFDHHHAQAGVGSSRYQSGFRPTAFPLAVLFEFSRGPQLQLHLDFEVGQFDEIQVERFGNYYRAAVQALVYHVDQPFSQFDLLTDRERRLLLKTWSHGGGPEEAPPLPHRLIEKRAAEMPFTTAVTLANPKEGSTADEIELTYEELNAMANGYAKDLMDRGVGPETVVAVLLDRSTKALIALAAVIKAGAVYLPLDADCSPERLAFILEDSNADLVLTRAHLAPLLPQPLQTTALLMDGEPPDFDMLSTLSGANPTMEPLPQNTLAVFYTSGSDGQPKGVPLSYAAVARHAADLATRLHIRERERVLQFAPMDYDAALVEMLVVLISGAHLILRGDVDWDKHQLIEALHDYTVDTAFLPCTWWTQMLQEWAESVEPPPHLEYPKRTVLSGQALSPNALAIRKGLGFRETGLYNLYGATEVCVGATCYRVPLEVNLDRVPIGKLLPRRAVYILDRFLNPTPVGVFGQIHIGGSGLTRGYLGRGDLTADRFIPNPFGPDFGEDRLYRSGDLGRFLPDGNIEFLTRMENRVRVYGYRITLGEIEQALCAHPEVVAAAVMTYPSEGRQALAAFVVAEEPKSGKKALERFYTELRRFLISRLHDHMTPDSFNLVDALPLLANGKVDRRALAQLEIRTAVLPHVSPRTQDEKLLARAWCDVLGLPAVGIHDNFFTLGGHSLAAITLIARLRRSLKMAISPAVLYRAPTIAAFADHLETLRDEARASSRTPIFTPPKEPPPDPGPLSFVQERLWFMDRFMGDNAFFHRRLALRLEGALNPEVLERAFAEVIRRHPAVRTTFRAVDGLPRAWVDRAVPPQIERVDLSDLTGDPRAMARDRLLQEPDQPFDLETGPLYHLSLVQLTHDVHLLLLTWHPIAFDRDSATMFLREWAVMYRAYSRNQDTPLPEPTLDYAAYAVWQHQWIKSKEGKRHLDYWREHLAEPPDPPAFPLDHVRPPIRTFSRAVEPIRLSPGLTRELKVLAAGEDVTTEMVLLAGYAAMLARYCGQRDLLIGSSISVRPHRDLNLLVGCFTNTLVRRIHLGDVPDFIELLARIRKLTLKAAGHQTVPFESLLGLSQTVRNLSRPPLVQLGFEYHENAHEHLEIPGLSIFGVDLPERESEYELCLQLHESAGIIQGFLIYNEALFQADTIRDFLSAWHKFLVAALTHPNQGLSQLYHQGGIRLIHHAAGDPNLFEDLREESNLTENQLRIWVAQEAYPDKPLFNDSPCYTIREAIDPILFSDTFQFLVNACDTLRTVIEEEEGIPRRRVRPQMFCAMACVDFSWCTDPHAAADAWCREHIHTLFALSHRCFEAVLLKLGEQEYQWFLQAHRIIADRASLNLLMRWQLELYHAGPAGRTPAAAKAIPSFEPFAEAEREYRGDVGYRRSATFWKRKLTQPVHPGSYYGRTASGRSPAMTHLRFPLGEFRSRNVLAHLAAESARTERTWLSHFFTSALAVYLFRIRENGDVLIGVQPLDRKPEHRNLIGPLASDLPLRLNVTSDDPFSTLHETVASELAKTFRYGKYGAVYSTLQSPIEVTFTYQDDDHFTVNQTGVQVTTYHAGSGAGVLEVVLRKCSQGNLILDLGLSDEVFENQQAEYAGRHLLQIVDQILTDPSAEVGSIQTTPVEERRQLLESFNQTQAFYPVDLPVTAMFENRAVMVPDMPALFLEDDFLSYGELRGRVGALAQRLVAGGASPEVPVGVFLERSADLIVSLLAILETGATYLPLDTAYPEERLDFILEDARPVTIITRKALEGGLPRHESQVLYLEIGDTTSNPHFKRVDPPMDCTACLIYTSGTTGLPKAVMVPHRGLMNLVAWHLKTFDIHMDDRASLLAAPAFDASIWELWPYLAAGAAVLLPGAEVLTTPESIRDWLIQRSVTMAFVPTPMAEAMIDLEWPEQTPLRFLLTGGEALHHTPSGSLPFRLFNHYGPTEGCVVACADEMTASQRRPTIGKPICNARAYVLDHHLEPTPLGQPGELYLAGDLLSRGYLHRPNKTARAFVPDPFTTTPGERIYRTGDWVRFLPDGRLEFLGRMDQQVKLHGHRIEILEIETHLWEHPLVTMAAVEVVAGRSRSDDLIAYVQPAEYHPNDRSANTLTERTIRRYLKRKLPDYMMPEIALVELLPLTPNGKVDRRALPMPGPRDQRYFVPPRRPAEEVIAAIWRHTLNIQRVSVFDDFFRLGGESFTALQVVARIREAFGVDLSVRLLFENPTIDALARHITQTRFGRYEEPAHVPRGQSGDLSPVSYTQQRLWFLIQLENSQDPVSLSYALRIRGVLNPDALERAVEEVVRRHENLRATFTQIDGFPYQEVGALQGGLLHVEDFSNFASHDRVRHVFMASQADAEHHFDLERGPLFRTRLLKLNKQEHILLLNLHQLVADEWSIGILLKEISLLYRAFIKGAPSPLPDVTYRFADFAAWQRHWLTTSACDRQLNYWRQRLEDLPILDFPTDRSRPAFLSFKRDITNTTLSTQLTASLRRLAGETNCSTLVLLLTAYQVLLSRHTGQEDIAVGFPVSGRNLPETEKAVGLFANHLTIRTDLSGDPPFVDLLRQVRAHVLEACDHGDIPFARLVEDLNPDRDSSRNPLYQASLQWRETPPSPLDIPGLDVEPVTSAKMGNNLDLTLSGFLSDGKIQLALNYNADLFEDGHMRIFLEQLCFLLEQVCEKPRREIMRYSLITRRARLVLPDPKRSLDPTWQEPVQAWLARAREKNPKGIAVVDGATSWTYEVFHDLCSRVANYLIKKGIQPGDVVAVYGGRTAGLVPALYGVLEAGAAFLILDPASPPVRLDAFLEAAKPKAWIQLESAGAPSQDLVFQPEALPCFVVLPEDPRRVAEFEKLPKSDPSPPIDPDRPAFITFTSGKHPKGVIGRYGPLSHFTPWLVEQFGFDASDRFAMLPGLAHEPLLWDIFTPLSVGAELHIPKAEDFAPNRLTEWLRENQITIAHMTPSTGRVINENPTDISLKSLRYVFFFGDVLTSRDVSGLHRLAPRARVVNIYGTAESQGAVGYYPVPEYGADRIQFNEMVPLGKGFPDVQLLVLNRDGELAGIGELGEIHIRSPHLAAGYLNNDELNRGHFFSDGPGPERIYRTGDLGRYRADGNVVFAGRMDRRIQFRGFRVEPEEIESLLSHYPGIREALVLSREDRPGRMTLVAYLRLDGEHGELELPAVRRFLKERLPEFMVPGSFVVLQAFPLNTEQLVAREALPVPDPGDADGVFVPPHTPEEEVVAAIWAEVLGREQISVNDHFFDMGGNSVLATRVMSRVRATFDLELPLRTLFESATVEQFCEVLEKTRGGAYDESLAHIRPVDRDGHLPLSHAQERLWSLYQLDGPDASFNMILTLDLEGSLSREALEQAVMQLIARHQVLRARFPVEHGRPVQKIDVQFARVLTWLQADPDDQTDLIQLARDFAEHPFDLATGPLVRVGVIRRDPQSHLLILAMHQIIADGWSLGIAAFELNLAYQRAVDTEDDQRFPPDLSVQYQDFAAWQRTWLTDHVLDKQRHYWKRRLSGAPPLLNLPTDRARSSTGAAAYDQLPLTVGEAITAGIKTLCSNCRTTLFMTLLGGFNLLLSRYTHETDLVTGSPIIGRNREELEPLIGFFVNILALRIDLSGNPSVRGLLNRVRETTLGAYAHQDLPYECLIHQLQVERVPHQNPLFQVMFVLENPPKIPARLGNLNAKPLDGSGARENIAANLDFTLRLKDEGGALSGVLIYNKTLFDAVTMQRLAGHFTTVLQGMVVNPKTPISQISLLTRAERESLARFWNGPAVPDLHKSCLHHLFEVQASRTPNAVALCVPSMADVLEGDLSLGMEPEVAVEINYRDLDMLADRMASRLQRLGVGPDDLVGIICKRSAEMVVALLGILKAGGAFLPLDPAHPPDRWNAVLEEAQPKLLLTWEALEAPAMEPAVYYLDDLLATLHGQSASAPEPVRVRPENLAYAIYTSGSTGRPKGILVPHAGLVNTISWDIRTFNPGVGSRLLHFVSMSFDAAVSHMFMTLCSGATLYLATSDILLLGSRIIDMLRNDRITHAAFPAPVLSALPVEELPDLTCLIAGADVVPLALVREWGRGRRFFNVYGPTEATISVTLAECLDEDRSPPIGRPIANVQTYLLDNLLRPVPVGIPGELFIGGIGVSRGYLNQGGLTAEKFVPNPLTDTGISPGSRLYRTGDLARFLADGNIEFLGRKDHQVKLRGYRLELGEIETLLLHHPAVDKAVVILRQTTSGDKQLAAYITCNGGEQTGETHAPVTPMELYHYLEGKLPGYMVPAAIVILDKMPYTRSGKVDRRLLPAPKNDRFVKGRKRELPRDELELHLMLLWESLLGVRPIGIRDGFFEMGGQSLLAVRLMAVIQKEMKRDLPLTLLFKNPSIEALAGELRQRGVGLSHQPVIPLQTGSGKDPLVLFHGLDGRITHYLPLVRELPESQTVFGVQAPLLYGGISMDDTGEMGARYAEFLMSACPEGGLYLAGEGFGGLLALETARVLHQKGRSVTLTVLIDTPVEKGDSKNDAPDHRALMAHLTGEPLSLGLSLEAEQALSESRRWERTFKVLVKAGVLPAGMTPEQFQRLYHAWRNHSRAQASWKKTAYPGDLVCIAPPQKARDTKTSWSRLCDALEVLELPGLPEHSLDSPAVEDTALLLNRVIQDGITKA